MSSLDALVAQQAALPRSIRLFRYIPERRPFTIAEFDPASVVWHGDLPPYLLLGPLDEASFERTAEGWTASYRGPESDTWLRICYHDEPGCYLFRQAWRGIAGPQAGAGGSLGLGKAIARFVLPRFPEEWDRELRDVASHAYQVRTLARSVGLPGFLGIPDGPFQSIACPVAVADLRRLRARLEKYAAATSPTFPISVEARLVHQSIAYLEGRAPEWTTVPAATFECSVADTGTVPLALPHRERTGDGVDAWRLDRVVYLVVVTVPFTAVQRVLAALAGRDMPVRRREDPPVRCEALPLVAPPGIELQCKSLLLWDDERTTCTTLLFETPYGVSPTLTAAAVADGERESEALLEVAERFSREVMAVAGEPEWHGLRKA